MKGLPGIEHVNRHDLQETLTGKRSTKDWTAADWDRAVSFLQRQNGQHNDRHAHIKSARPHGLAEEGGEFASWNQCRLIENLSDAIEWKLGREIGPIAYVCRHFLAGDEQELLRERLKKKHNEGSQYRGGQWRVLPRETASGLIQALVNMSHQYPKVRQIDA